MKKTTRVILVTNLAVRRANPTNVGDDPVVGNLADERDERHHRHGGELLDDDARSQTIAEKGLLAADEQGEFLVGTDPTKWNY